MTTEWPVVRQGWTGHRPQIFGNHSTADIFRLACRPGGATIKEMLRLRRDTGNDDDKKEAALKKLIKEIEKAYLVELIVNGVTDRPYGAIPGSANGASDDQLMEPFRDRLMEPFDDRLMVPFRDRLMEPSGF